MIYRWVYWLRHPFMTNWFLTSFNCVFPSCLITVACDSWLCWVVCVKMACFFKRSRYIKWNLSVCESSEQSLSQFLYMMCVQHEKWTGKMNVHSGPIQHISVCRSVVYLLMWLLSQALSPDLSHIWPIWQLHSPVFYPDQPLPQSKTERALF